jgi:hypothetical protein
LALASTDDGTWAISSIANETFAPLSHWMLGLERGDAFYDKLVTTLLSVIDCIQVSPSDSFDWWIFSLIPVACKGERHDSRFL